MCEALDYAVAIGGRTVHCMAGCVPPEQRPAAETVFIRNLTRAAKEAAKAGHHAPDRAAQPARPARLFPQSRRAGRRYHRQSRPRQPAHSVRFLSRANCMAAISSAALKRICRSSAMCRSPAFPRAVSPMRARSIIPKSSQPSTASATQALSAANTDRAAALRMVWVGHGRTVLFRAAEHSVAADSLTWRPICLPKSAIISDLWGALHGPRHFCGPTMRVSSSEE